MDFRGKTTIVTGGAKGIGRCIAEAFAAAGARVAVIDVDARAGDALAGRFDGQIWFFHGDIAEKETLEAFAQAFLERFGKVDCLIHNACLTRGGLLCGCGWEDFEYVQRVGVTAPYCLTRLLQAHFSEGAAIVNISSTRWAQSQPDTESYTAAKGGITALTHAMSASLAGKVRVNAISPGWIETGPAPDHTGPDKRQHPAGRVGRGGDIAALALFLCGEDAGFITGQVIAVDGGMGKLMIYHGDHGWSYQPG